jgi:anti-sigma28 factor (negative regulator of flagellin synthesis)
MSTPTYTEVQLQALHDALAKGEKRVTFGDKTVEYRTVEELKQAIAEVEAAMHKDAVATGLYPRAPRHIRVTTGKGF